MDQIQTESSYKIGRDIRHTISMIKPGPDLYQRQGRGILRLVAPYHSSANQSAGERLDKSVKAFGIEAFAGSWVQVDKQVTVA